MGRGLAIIGPVICLIVGLACGNNARVSGHHSSEDAQGKARKSVVYGGTVYVGLEPLLDLLGGTFELTRSGQSVAVVIQGKTWEFADGGGQLQDPTGQTRALPHPILVLDGKWFIPVTECASTFGYTVQGNPPSTIAKGGRKLELEPLPLEPESRRHQIRDLTVLHESVKTLKEVTALPSLHAGEPPVRIPAGRTLLARRKVTTKDAVYLIAADTGPAFRSYLIEEGEWKGKVQPAEIRDTIWSRNGEWFARQAEEKFGLRHGDREKFRKGISVTIDLCWSLRRYEEDFFQSFRKLAEQRNGLPVTIFVSGRWIDQHPEEMQSLITLSRQSGIDFLWGNHSWIHPKAGDFMNDLSLREVREDTLRLERIVLEWGIVPTVFYRFPGLIHDRARLQEVLGLDLLPIDCESWVGLIGAKHPYGNPIQDGGILLLHGNGNEPKGIAGFNKWLKEHPDWKFSPLVDFLRTEK